jgi:hypothetical protein
LAYGVGYYSSLTANRDFKQGITTVPTLVE